MSFREIETKYDSDSIKLKDFISFIEKQPDLKSNITVSSYDYYFIKSDSKFIRYRTGESPELTIKVKDDDSNNIFRTEMNLKIDRSMSLKDITMFCKLLGYEFNFCIFKVCHIYFFDDCNVVYYSVLDENLKEKRRFIEIEISEDSIKSEEEAWNRLISREKSLEELGINARGRLRKSLFEIFRKI